MANVGYVSSRLLFVRKIMAFATEWIWLDSSSAVHGRDPDLSKLGQFSYSGVL
jgi:hypothetical protein